MPMQSLVPAGPLVAVLFAVLVLAVWFDASRNRLPNWLTVGGMAAAFVLRSFIGIEAVGAGLLGAALGLSLGVLLFAAGARGAGDGKLLAAVGFLLGFDVFVRALPLMGLAGGVLGLVVAVRNRTFISTLSRFRALLFHVVSFGRLGERGTITMPGAVTVPYGVAVAAGAAWGCLAWGLSL
jgi:prepilin peptidase CpaA